MPSRLAIIATLTSAEGKEHELEAALSWMVGQIEAEAGTLVYALSKKEDAPGTFLFYELYEDEAAFKAHGTSDTMKVFGAKLAGLVAGRPEVTRLVPVAGKGLPA